MCVSQAASRISSMESLEVHMNSKEVEGLSRDQSIVDLVSAKGMVDIQRLAEQFGVTPQTIRRSVNRLCEQGRLRRVHGGVTLPAAMSNLPWDTRQVQQLQAKRAIARRVATLIPDGSSVSIGLGTTPHQVALALNNHQDLRVMTNSLRVALALASAPGVEIRVAGGALRLPDMDVVGDAAARFFGDFKTDFAVFGVGGIDVDGALLDFDPAEVAAREAMRQNCRSSVLVADVTKFGRAALARGGALGSMDHLVTNAQPESPFELLMVAGPRQWHLAEQIT